jgi:hypothetical protein
MFIATQPAYQSFEGRETLKKPLSKVPVPGFKDRGKSPELSAN